MKTVPLQLLTVNLEDGRQGVFIGIPLVTAADTDNTSQVEEIWFSDIQEIPANLSLAHLIKLVAAQRCRCRSGLQ